MSSDGKFFTKVKNAFKSDKKDTESSPNSSSKTSAPSASASKSHQKVIDEAYSEGRKFFHLKHSSSKGNIGSSSGSASGSGSSVEQGGKHSKDQHHDILRQAYKEGQKLFHYHAKHGVSSSTSQKQGTSPSTYAGAGVGATAGAGAGTVGASTGSGSPKTPSTPRENKSTTSSVASGLSHDREVIAESSIGRVVTSPPRRSREPLEHTIPGDFANEKRPTDSTVVVGGAAAAAGSGNAASGAQSTNASVDAPRYTDGAETVKGSGKYFDPKDTQGGVLGATKTDKDADAYNERTKAEYHDLSNLKTKPSYPEGTVEKGGDLETVKNLAYEEGKKKGKLDGDNGAFGTSNQSSTNFSSNSNPVEEKEIHQENKSAYNPGGVSAVFEENTTGSQATKSNAKSGSSGNTAAGVASGGAAAAGLAGVAASSGNSKQSSNDKSSSKGVYDISDAQGKDIPRNEIDHSSYKSTSSGLGSENLAAGSAATSSQIPASSNNEKQSLSDLEKKISETDARIRQLKQDPSNASTYAVHDEPIAAPELKDIDDGHNQVSDTDTGNATTATKVDNSSPEGVNSAGSAGIAAGATSALGAAAAYLGLSKGNKDTEPSDTAYSGAFKENQTSTLSKNAPTREVPASSYNEGQLKGLKDELYQAGYNQGKDIYAGIDKNSTKHRDALIAGNSDGKGDNVNRSLDPSSTSSSGSSRPENSKEQAEAIAAAAGGFGAVGYGSSTSKGANATTGNANLASESGKTGYHDGSKNDLSKEAYQAGKAKANAEKNATASHVPRTEAYEAGKNKAKTDKNAIAGAVPTGEAYQAGKDKGYNEKDSSTSAVPRAEAYQAGKTQGYEDKDISASTVPREQAYQAGKNKAETERDSSTLKQSGDTLASTDSETSSPSKGYLAAAGAAIGGAVGYAFGGKGSKENDVDDSLIEDAEKVDPTISKLPQHKVDDKELKRETTLSRDATFDEKELVASNDRKIWEKETDDYNKKHGFTNQTDSLIQEAAEVDPSITQLPAHKLKNQEGKEVKPKVAEANPEEVDTSAIQNFRKLEDDVSTYNKKHGHTGPQESLLAVAEEADPKILKLPTHKGDFNETKLVDPVGAAEPGEVQKLPANHPTARHREVSENIKSDKTVDAGTIQDSNKKHDHQTSTAVGTGAALGAGAGLAAGSSAHSHAAEQEPTHKSQLDPELKKDLYSQGYTKGRSSHSSGPSSTAAGTGAGLVAGSSAHSHSAEYDATHKSQLDSDLKKDLYSQGYTKGKSSHSSVPSSASDSHNHHRTVSGTSYNATKPINEGELPEPDLQDDVSGHDSRKSGAGIGAAALAGGAIGGGAAALATSDKHLDHNLKSELYEAGRSKGLAGSSQTEHADSTLDPKLQTTAYDAGQAKGLNTTGSTNLGLHPTLKEQLYNEGYTSATTGHPYLGKQDAKQDVGATREISSLDPAQNHKLYEPSHNQGYFDSAVQGNYSTANPSKSEVLDSKLKQDIYEHGYAKGSTEAKQEKQKASPYGHPTGSSNREAAVVGGAGLAGLAAGAAGTFGHHKESPKFQQQDKNIESVEEVSAAESRASNKDDLVVEVIGIEDREEALNTAKKASKKLDAKGVDLTTGKLVINANTKEIYKAEEPEGLTNQSASKDIQSSGLSQNTSVGSRAPSSQPAADSTHSSSPSSTSGKVDTYQQTEAAKKRLAEAARKNVTSTQKHSNSGLTGGEATALGAGVAGTAGIASVAGHNSHKSTDVNHIPSHATVLKEIDPPNTHKHGYEGDGGISSQPPVKKQDTETSTSDDEIFVNVKGTKDNVLATKIARTAVARLQKTHASVVAKVKELQVDATSGIVRNENGQEIAQYPDLAVEKNKSGTESVGQGAKSLESPKHKDAISHGHSSKDHIKDRDTHSTGAAVTGGVAGTAAAAAAAAAAATAHGKSRNEPTASTHGQSSSRVISDAGTGHQDEKNVANTPQHHYGNQNVGSNSYSPDTYGSAIGTLGVQEKTAPAVTGIHSKGIGAAAYPELTNAGNTGLAKGTAPASTSATYGESPSADYSKSGATGAVPATYLNTSGAPTGSLNTAGVVGGAGFGDNSNTSSYHQTGRERKYEAPSLQSESGLHTTQANKGSLLGGLALGETNIRGTNFASKDSNYSLSGSGAQSQHGQAVGNSEIPKSIGTTNVGNTNRYSVDNKNLSGRSTTGAGAGNTIAGDADDADSSFFSVAETSTYSMPGSWN